MKLGYSIGYWPPGGPPPGAAEVIAEAERLGFDSLWTAEAYGSDALTPLAWWGAQTERMRLGTAIAQISARTPAATAMAAITHGPPLGRALHPRARRVRARRWSRAGTASRSPSRSRARASTSRSCATIWARKGPVAFDGRALPAAAARRHRAGQAAEVDRAPAARGHPDLPRAEGPKNIALAAELCRRLAGAVLLAQPRLLPRRCWPRASPGRRAAQPDDFEVVATVPLIVADDVEAAADMLRPDVRPVLRRHGRARGATSTPTSPIRMGYEDEVDEDPGRSTWTASKDEAAAAVPTRARSSSSRSSARVEKIRDDLEAWRESRVDTLLIGGGIDQVRQAAELVLG